MPAGEAKEKNMIKSRMVVLAQMFYEHTESSWAVKPPFRNAGYRRSSNGVPLLLLAD